MGVSRTPVREAIQRLTYDGLVVGEPYRGVFVRELSHKEAQDLYELRAALEGTAALLASSRATTADIAGLEALLEEIRMARQKGDWPNSLLGNHAFHRRIGQTSANEAIMNQLDTVLSQISLWRTAYMHTGGTYRDTFPEHAAIMEALARREGSTARVLMEEHIMRSWRNSTGSSER
jgi:DNA-binding GntR family transcriptional regulator